MNLLDEILESLENDPDAIPVIRSRGKYIDQNPIEDLSSLNLKSHVSESGICVSHAWIWNDGEIDTTIMMHIISGHEEEYQRLLNEEPVEMG